MTTHDDSRITDWLAGGEGHGRAAAIDAALAAARSTNQRPAWMVSLTGGTFAEPRGTVLLRRSIVVLVAVLLVGGLLVGGLAAGGVLPLRLPQQPVPSAAAIAPSPAAAFRRHPMHRRPRRRRARRRRASWPTRSSTAVADRCSSRACTTRPWLAAADGRDAHVIAGHERRRVVGRRLEARARERQRRGRRRQPAPRRPDRRRGRDDRGPVHGPVDRRQELGGAAPRPPVPRSGRVRAVARRHPRGLHPHRPQRRQLLGGLHPGPRHRPEHGAHGDAHHQSPGRRCLQHEHQDPHLPGVRRQPALVAGRPEHRLRASADGARARRLLGQRRAVRGGRRRQQPPPGDAVERARHRPGLVPGRHPPRLRGVRHGRQRRRDQRAWTSSTTSTPSAWTAAGWHGSPTTGSRASRTGRQGGGWPSSANAAPTSSEHWIMDADGGNQSRLGGSLAELTAAGCTTCVYVAHEPVGARFLVRTGSPSHEAVARPEPGAGLNRAVSEKPSSGAPLR